MIPFLNDFVYPVLDHYNELPVNSVVGRYSLETRLRDNRPIGDVLVELTGLTGEEAEELAIENTTEISIPLKRFDQEDFHVWSTAIQQECDYIITSNTRRFPAEIGRIKRIHPIDFYKQLDDYLNS